MRERCIASRAGLGGSTTTASGGRSRCNPSRWCELFGLPGSPFLCELMSALFVRRPSTSNGLPPKELVTHAGACADARRGRACAPVLRRGGCASDITAAPMSSACPVVSSTPCCDVCVLLSVAVVRGCSQIEYGFGQTSSTVAPSRLRELHEMVCRSVSQRCVACIFRASL